MKIAVWHNLPSGGGKRALYNHVKGLLERGHTLESWCPPTADQTYLPLSDLIKENIVPLAQPTERADFVGSLFNPYQKIVDSINAMHHHSQQCANEINHAGFDILLANSCKFFHAPVIGQYIKIPKAVYLGEPYRLFYEAMPRLPWLALPPPNRAWWSSPRYLRWFLKNLIEVHGLRVQAREELRNIKAFDLILVNSLFSRESVQRAYGLDSKVCYLGIDSDIFKPLNLARNNIVVGLGSINGVKGLERAVNAIATIDKDKRPSLIWIGNVSDTIYQNQIEKLAFSLGVNFVPKVRISDQELISLLNQASVMIYTSVLEPFGLAPLEANACETPVVAIAEGGVRESIKDGINGFLINGNQPVEMGRAISRLLTDKELAYRMGKQARSHVLEKWSLDSAIARLEESLLNLTKEAKIIDPILASI
ncbi:putative glycosyl transferase [Kalymmatonema gypsitolerans NIES-4073]|nr:putative glycosyl transferase [Scytonema sp. NIES-4073]